MREETLCAGYRQALERRARDLIEQLGERWLLHPKNGPRKGKYNTQGTVENHENHIVFDGRDLRIAGRGHAPG